MTVEFNTLSYILLTTIFTATSYIAVKNARHPDIHPFVLNNQGEFSPIRYPKQSAVIKSPNHPITLKYLDRPILTLYDFYTAIFKKHHKDQFLGIRQSGNINWQSHENVLEKMKNVFSGLVYQTKLKPCSENESSFVGIYASTSPDAYMTEIACHWGGLVTIPIAAQASSSHILHVLRNTRLRVLVIDETHLEYILPLIVDTNVTHIVTIGTESHKSFEKDFGVTITSLLELVDIGKENLIPNSNKLGLDSIASIYYSSKLTNNTISTTTNDQNDKSLGVVLTHKNIIYAIANQITHMPNTQKIKQSDRFMHSFAIDNVLGYVLEAVSAYLGASIVFEDKLLPNEFNVNISSVLSTVAELKPTIYASGTPFLRQVQKLIESKYGNSFIFQRGLDRKNRYFKEGRLVSDCIYDMLVFRDIRQHMFGGNIRLLYMDDDDIPKKNISSFYRAILSSQVIKMLSRPETSSTMAAIGFYDYMCDQRTVGPPSASTEIKLKDVQEYTVEDKPNPRGEIVVRGNNVFLGYWNDEKTTLDKLNPDGWYETGLLGELLPNGCFMVLGYKN